MPKINPRYDSWTTEEEEVVQERIIRYVKEGKPIYQAFSDLELVLPRRTMRAIQFYWNSVLKFKNNNINKVDEARRHVKMQKRRKRLHG